MADTGWKTKRRRARRKGKLGRVRLHFKCGPWSERRLLVLESTGLMYSSDMRVQIDGNSERVLLQRFGVEVFPRWEPADYKLCSLHSVMIIITILRAQPLLHSGSGDAAVS